jgi:hydrogenase expression/formation protein HypC
MCLGVPGKVVDVGEVGAEMPMGRVEFGGIVREICLACTPDVQVGEYVLVHAGFAINTLSESEAQETFEYLRQIDALNEELGAPDGPTDVGGRNDEPEEPGS